MAFRPCPIFPPEQRCPDLPSGAAMPLRTPWTGAWCETGMWGVLRVNRDPRAPTPSRRRAIIRSTHNLTKISDNAAPRTYTYRRF